MAECMLCKHKVTGSTLVTSIYISIYFHKIKCKKNSFGEMVYTLDLKSDSIKKGVLVQVQ